MLDEADRHFKTILDLSDQLAAVAQSGFSSFDDDGSLLLNGIVCDCAFRLRDAVEVELKAHLVKGPCDGRTGSGSIGRKQRAAHGCAPH